MNNWIGDSATLDDTNEGSAEKLPDADSGSKDHGDEVGATVASPSRSAKDLLRAINAKTGNPIMQTPVGQFLRTELANCARTNTTPPVWFTRLAMPQAVDSSSSSKHIGEKFNQSREGRLFAPSRQNPEPVGLGAEHTGDQTPTPIRRPSGSTESIRADQPRDSSRGGMTTAPVAFTSSLSSVRNIGVQEEILSTTPDRPIGHVEHTPSFTMEQSDLPLSVRLTGAPSEDVPGIMQHFWSWVYLSSGEDSLNDEVDKCAVKYLPLLVRKAAADSMHQLLSWTVEWRSENELAELNADGAGIYVRAPVLWHEWVSAFTQLFTPANLVALLARSITTLKQAADKSVVAFSLRVNKSHSRLLAEAKRTALAGTSPHSHALEALMSAYFENGLLPRIGLESIREEPSCSFQAALARARKHETDNLREQSAQNPSACASAVTSVSPQQCQLQRRLETSSRPSAGRPRGDGRRRSEWTPEPSALGLQTNEDAPEADTTPNLGSVRPSLLGRLATTPPAATGTLTLELTVELLSSMRTGGRRSLRRMVEGARAGLELSTTTVFICDLRSHPG